MDAFRRKTIHEAMVRLADGDRSAMQVLVNELWPVILAFAERGLRHEQDAEDVAQEVFLRICARISDFEPSRDGLSWAFGIANYEVLTQRRRRSRRRELSADHAFDAEVDPGASQEERVVRSELLVAMQHAVGELSDDDRATLGLTDARQSPVLPLATLRKRRQRAIERLRGAWRRLYGEP
jgi:RNA polymerase sigma-70 factor (ECF subfamily)